MPRLLAFAGSARKGSFNHAVARAAAQSARSAGADVELIDLADYALPLFDADLESAEGMPEHARRLKEQFRAADGFLVASPEYNSAYSPLMKNTIDWCSRPESNEEPPLAAYEGKSAVLLSASPGPLGGLRGLYALRDLFLNIGVTVYPDLLAIRSAHHVIGDDGSIIDPKWSEKIEDLTHAFVAFAERHRAGS